ncbi:hypothetical protein, partial [Enterococcus hirae]|uniref:hypothetical protein n=1 Tax=Enterococcus hirae TaxID=1354 RepID=UPI003CE8FE92
PLGKREEKGGKKPLLVEAPLSSFRFLEKVGGGKKKKKKGSELGTKLGRANSVKPAGLVPLVRVNSELGVIMVIAVSCVKLLSAHNSTQHTSRKHKV